MRLSIGKEFLQKRHLVSLVRQFDLGEEDNTPTMYQTFALLGRGAIQRLESLRQLASERGDLVQALAPCRHL